MQVKIGEHWIGGGRPTYIVAEIGINHNGSLETVCELIEAAADAGCDAVKFQKRTVDRVYTEEELARPRESVFGHTNGDLKRGLELDGEGYDYIASLCSFHCLDWFASPWDMDSVDFLEEYRPLAYKIASASITDTELVGYIASTGKPIIMSTGMSTLEQIDEAVNIIQRCGDQLILMHCVSTYPSDNSQLNLRCIESLRQRYGVPVGYSGHEHGLATTVAAVAMGACMVERHLTLDRSLWGSDQSASIEPHAFKRLVRDIRAVESALGDGVKQVLPEEVTIAAKLRRVSA